MAVINMKYPIDHALVTTYQAISGAGKTFETWPEMVDNLIPYIGGEEMKSEVEPNKVLGKIEVRKLYLLMNFLLNVRLIECLYQTVTQLLSSSHSRTA
mgnify:CR=1 FL=1